MQVKVTFVYAQSFIHKNNIQRVLASSDNGEAYRIGTIINDLRFG